MAKVSLHDRECRVPAVQYKDKLTRIWFGPSISFVFFQMFSFKRRRPLEMTSRDAPISAAIAIQSVAIPAVAG